VTRGRAGCLAVAATAIACACGSKAWTPPTGAAAGDAPAALAARGGGVRLVGMIGVPLRLPLAATSRGAAQVVPPLPAGLALIASGAELAGTPTGLAAPTRHALLDAGGATLGELVLEVVAAPRPGVDLVVAPGGDDAAGTGAEAAPLATATRALALASPGAIVFVRGGVYGEPLVVQGVRGEADRPITVRGWPGEHAVFRAALPAVQWARAAGPGAAPDEWVTTAPLAATRVSRGVLGAAARYTRLLTYSQLGDLRAQNQRWELDGPAPGPTPVAGPRRPWTYFGPGLWFDEATGLTHLRLSPTANATVGIDDYVGPSDPVAAGVEVSAQDQLALEVRGSAAVRLVDLTFRGGGEHTARIEGSDDVLLDHVVIEAATYGLTIADSRRVRVWHTRLDGGVPPWSFRSDFKADYKLLDPAGATVENNLVRKTSRALLFVGNKVEDLEVAYSELGHAHDVYFAGARGALHHSYVHDLHDEALFLGHTADSTDLLVHDNVFERVLSAIGGPTGKVTGPRYLYRNLFDLREPTPGLRPGAGDGVWRYGHPFKELGRSPTYFYRNTILIAEAGDQAVAPFFRNLEPGGQAAVARWFVGNVIAVADAPGNDRTLAFIPDDTYRTARDSRGEPLLRSGGNVWVRPAGARAAMFACMTKLRGKRCARAKWAEVGEASRDTGFELGSAVVSSPGFRRLGSLRARGASEDLRPATTGAARRTRQALPAWLPGVAGEPDEAGAFAGDAPARRVGVDGARVY
jgi:hypothetical protein